MGYCNFYGKIVPGDKASCIGGGGDWIEEPSLMTAVDGSPLEMTGINPEFEGQGRMVAPDLSSPVDPTLLGSLDPDEVMKYMPTTGAVGMTKNLPVLYNKGVPAIKNLWGKVMPGPTKNTQLSTIVKKPPVTIIDGKVVVPKVTNRGNIFKPQPGVPVGAPRQGVPKSQQIVPQGVAKVKPTPTSTTQTTTARSTATAEAKKQALKKELLKKEELRRINQKHQKGIEQDRNIWGAQGKTTPPISLSKRAWDLTKTTGKVGGVGATLYGADQLLNDGDISKYITNYADELFDDTPDTPTDKGVSGDSLLDPRPEGKIGPLSEDGIWRESDKLGGGVDPEIQRQLPSLWDKMQTKGFWFNPIEGGAGGWDNRLFRLGEMMSYMGTPLSKRGDNPAKRWTTANTEAEKIKKEIAKAQGVAQGKMTKADQTRWTNMVKAQASNLKLKYMKDRGGFLGIGKMSKEDQESAAVAAAQDEMNVKYEMIGFGIEPTDENYMKFLELKDKGMI